MSGFLYAITAAVLWGITYTIDQRILTKVSPQLFIVISSVVCLLIIVPTMGHQDWNVIRAHKIETVLTVIASVINMVGSYCILKSIQSTNAASASIIEISYPFFVVLFSWIAYRQQISFKFLVGGFLIFIGTAVVLMDQIKESAK